MAAGFPKFEAEMWGEILNNWEAYDGTDGYRALFSWLNAITKMDLKPARFAAGHARLEQLNFH